jgi:hypothetical protein
MEFSPNLKIVQMRGPVDVITVNGKDHAIAAMAYPYSSFKEMEPEIETFYLWQNLPERELVRGYIVKKT